MIYLKEAKIPALEKYAKVRKKYNPQSGFIESISCFSKNGKIFSRLIFKRNKKKLIFNKSGLNPNETLVPETRAEKYHCTDLMHANYDIDLDLLITLIYAGVVDVL